MRTRLFLASLATFLLGSFSAEAALSKYAIRTTTLIEYNSTSPSIEILTNEPTGDASGTVVIDNDGGSNFPILKKYKEVSGGGPNGTTISVPVLSGFIYIKQRAVLGPASAHTGTGDVGATIEWGDVVGWTTTGGSFCNSVPASICNVNAMRADDETVPPPLDSSHHLVHMWTFHGTGFRGDARLQRTSNINRGNQQVIPRGAKRQDSSVPTLPLIGILVVGVSVLSLGASSLRKR